MNDDQQPQKNPMDLSPLVAVGVLAVPVAAILA